MKPRLELMKNLLSEQGVIAIQVDDNEYASLDILMSNIFDEKNRIGTIIWRRRLSQANLSKGISTIHDYILLYAKNKKKLSRSMIFDPLWIDTTLYGNNQIATKEIEKYFGDRTLFDTPKPEALLTHLISRFTNPGDMIMDCFSGSGTTITIAHRLKRKWIGIELHSDTLELSKKRICAIMNEENMNYAGFSVYTCHYQLENHKNQSSYEKKELYEMQQEDQLINLDWHGKNKESALNDMKSLIKEIIIDECEIFCGKPREDSQYNSIVQQLQNENQGKRIMIFEDPIQIFKNLPLNIKQNIPEQTIKTIICSPPIEIQTFTNPKWSIEHYLNYCYELLRILYMIMDENSFLLFHSIEPHYSKIKLILDEIFGQKNHVGTVIWKKFKDSNSHPITECFDMILIFSKNIQKMKFYKLEPPQEVYSNPDNDPRGPWVSMPLIASEKSTNPCFTYVFKNGFALTRKFRYPEYSIRKLEEENRIHFTHPKKGDGIPRVKKFLYERLEKFESTGAHGYTPNTLCTDTEKFGSIDANTRNNHTLGTLGIQQYRTKGLYEFLCKITTKKGDWIFDCFPQTGAIHESIIKMGRNIIEIRFTRN
jgi:adenine specific DNA methylase Mod